MNWKNFVSPFEKVAGVKALAFGVAGLAVSAVASIFSGLHVNGLLQYGPASTNVWWAYVVEYLIIWLVPAAIIYALGAALSRSRIRPVDVLGTVAFSMLPLVVVSLVWLLPGMGELLDAMSGITVEANEAAVASGSLDMAAVMTAVKTILTNPMFIISGIVSAVAIVWMLVWLFRAVKVACNLNGWQLWMTWLAGVLVGDIVCRLLIGLIR